MLEAWLWLLPLLGVGQLVMARDNLRLFQAVPPASAGEGVGRISVLVPARDEAPRIAACVRALLDQPEVAEVLVLDDGSSDGTAEVARRAGAGDRRLVVLPGAAPPPGWVGKGHACAQLAAVATGGWLMFVDADVRLAPGAVAEARRRAVASGADLLSFWPRQALGSPGERLLVPLLDVVLLGFLPFRLAAARPEPALVAANGQCLLVRAGAYWRAGGHASVRADLVEDVALARAMKRAGGRVVLTDAGHLAQVRMYSGLGEAWAGFRKNLYPGFGGQAGPFLTGMGLFALLHALPPWLALLALAAGRPELAGPFALQAALALALRGLLVARLGHPARAAFGHWGAAALVLALGAASWRAAARGAITWKGRTYALAARP